MISSLTNLMIAFMWYGYYSDVTMSVIASQITGVSIVYSTFVQEQINENIIATRHWPFCGEFTGDRWNPRTQRATNAENGSIWWRHHGVNNAEKLI